MPNHFAISHKTITLTVVNLGTNRTHFLKFGNQWYSFKI